MNCIDLMSKRSKQCKTPNAIKLCWICIDLTSKWSKMLSYVANHSKPLNYKSDQIGRQNEQKWWVTSQNIQNDAKLWKWSNYNELHRFDVQTIKNVELRRKPFKTAKLQKRSDWTSKRSKILSYVSKHSKQR